MVKRLNGNSLRAVRKRVFEAKGHRCYYCGNEATVVDHYIPLSKGGDYSMDNLVPACVSCNSIKSDSIATRQIYISNKYRSLENVIRR